MSHHYPIRLYEWFQLAGVMPMKSKADAKAQEKATEKESKLEVRLHFYPRLCVYTGLKLQQLSHRPIVYSISSFLKDDEIKDIMKLVKNAEIAQEFKTSIVQVEDEKHTTIQSQRSSSTLFLSDVFAVIGLIKKRVALLVGTDVDFIEPLQLVRYEKGQQFGLHHDSGTIVGERISSPGKSETWLKRHKYEIEATEPYRVCSLFVYLNTLSSPTVGGQTSFPCTYPEILMTPQAGTALFWSNMKLPSKGTLKKNRVKREMNAKTRFLLTDHMEADARTVHEALPVLTEREVKYGMNIWIRSKSVVH